MRQIFLLLVAALTASGLCCGNAAAAATMCKTYYANSADRAPPEVARLLRMAKAWRSRVDSASPDVADISILMCRFARRSGRTYYSLQMPVQRTGHVCHFLGASVTTAFGNDVRKLSTREVAYENFLSHASEAMQVAQAQCPPPSAGGYILAYQISPDLFQELFGAWKRFLSGKAAFDSMTHIDVSDRGPTGQYDPVKDYEEFKKYDLSRYLAHPPSPDSIGTGQFGTKRGDYEIMVTDPMSVSMPNPGGWNFTFRKEGGAWKVIRMSFWVT